MSSQNGLSNSRSMNGLISFNGDSIQATNIECDNLETNNFIVNTSVDFSPFTTGDIYSTNATFDNLNANNLNANNITIVDFTTNNLIVNDTINTDVGCTGTIYATNGYFSGNITGTFSGSINNSDNILTSLDSTNTNRYISFNAGNTGYQSNFVDGNLLYNPSSNTLTCVNGNFTNMAGVNFTGPITTNSNMTFNSGSDLIMTNNCVITQTGGGTNSIKPSFFLGNISTTSSILMSGPGNLTMANEGIISQTGVDGTNSLRGIDVLIGNVVVPNGNFTNPQMTTETQNLNYTSINDSLSTSGTSQTTAGLITNTISNKLMASITVDRNSVENSILVNSPISIQNNGTCQNAKPTGGGCTYAITNNLNYISISVLKNGSPFTGIVLEGVPAISDDVDRTINMSVSAGNTIASYSVSKFYFYVYAQFNPDSPSLLQDDIYDIYVNLTYTSNITITGTNSAISNNSSIVINTAQSGTTQSFTVSSGTGTITGSSSAAGATYKAPANEYVFLNYKNGALSINNLNAGGDVNAYRGIYGSGLGVLIYDGSNGTGINFITLSCSRSTLNITSTLTHLSDLTLGTPVGNSYTNNFNNRLDQCFIPYKWGIIGYTGQNYTGTVILNVGNLTSKNGFYVDITSNNNLESCRIFFNGLEMVDVV